MRIELRAPDRELAVALGRLAAGPARIRHALDRETERVARPLLQHYRAAVLAIEAGGSEHTGLRAATANAVEVKVTYRGASTGIRVRVNLGKMPANQRGMPENLNKGRWRHPVHGNRKVWVAQKALPRGWFDTTSRVHGPAGIKAIEAAANRAVQELQ